MEFVESERLELKREINEKICKAVIAFANTLGGRIIVGIDDIGRVIGVDDVDAEMLKASNLIKDCICPEIIQLVDIAPFELEGKTLISIDVEGGDEKPYYLAAKGLCPSGIYTRLGPANVPVDRRGIRKMIRVGDGISFETEQCKQQDLSFDVADRIFSKHGLDFGSDALLKTLGIKNHEGFFTNLALLISDDNPYEIKCAAFNDDAFTEFMGREDCQGSIFSQLETAEKLFNPVNSLRSYFPPGELERIDKRDYPPEAIREGILNTIVHRDYDDAQGAPTLIKMNRTEIRFISNGGLLGIGVNEALSGVSKTRNPRLQKLLLHLGLIEAIGTGLPTIFKLYEPEELSPEFIDFPNTVILVLPNLNTTRNKFLSVRRNDGPNLRGSYEDYLELERSGALPPDVKAAFQIVKRKQVEARRRTQVNNAEVGGRDERAVPEIRIESIEQLPSIEVGGLTVERALIKLAAENGGAFTRQEAEEALDAGRDVTLKVINGMLENGQLVKEGKARATRYRLAM